MFSSPSFADWERVTGNVSGDVFYVDFERIKKNRGYVYSWGLLDRLKPTRHGDLSSKSLYEVDCNIPIKKRSIARTYYTQQMGVGVPSTTDNGTTEWRYPST